MARRTEEWRQEIKARLLSQLRRSNRPLTTGDLFLLLKESHTIINKYLGELRADGLVCCDIRDSVSVNYTGGEIIRPARHWSAASVIQARSINRKIRS